MPSDRNRRPKPTNSESSSTPPSRSSSSQPAAPSTGGDNSSSRRASSRRQSSISSSTAPVSPTGRNRAQERIKERQQEKRRQQFTIGGVAIAVLIGLIVLAILLVNQPADAPIPAESAARYDGLQASRNQDGYPELGDPSTPIQVSVYTSFDCAECATFNAQIMPGLAERVRNGGMSVVFVPLHATGDVTNGRGAVASAICISEQDPSAFWEVQDAFFSWQGMFGNQSFTDPRIRTLAESLDMDMGAFYGCINSERTNNILNTASTQVRSLANYTGTPAVAINGIIPLGDDGTPITDVDALFAVIDERLADSQRPAATTEPEIESTQEATVESTSEVDATIEATGTPEADSTTEATAESTP